MPKFAANLHYMFNEVPFLDRFALAADVGFRAVNFRCLPWPAKLLKEVATERLSDGSPDTKPGDWDAGERAQPPSSGARRSSGENSRRPSNIAANSDAIPCIRSPGPRCRYRAKRGRSGVRRDLKYAPIGSGPSDPAVIDRSAEAGDLIREVKPIPPTG